MINRWKKLVSYKVENTEKANSQKEAKELANEINFFIEKTLNMKEIAYAADMNDSRIKKYAVDGQHPDVVEVWYKIFTPGSVGNSNKKKLEEEIEKQFG